MSNKTQITIGNKSVTVFQIDGSYFYTLTSLAGLIGKDESSPRKYIESKTFKTLYGKGSDYRKEYQENGVDYILVGSDVAMLYLMNWCSKGHQEAVQVVMSLASESLDTRALSAFGELTQESYVAVTEKVDQKLIDWQEARNLTKRGHQDFWRACLLKKFNGAMVHNYITKLITGKTAEEARQTGQLVSDSLDPTVGLNYQPNALELAQIGLAKDIFCDLKKGTWQEQADRAVFKSLELMPN